jgi:ATP-dependent RNA helicase RhlE
MSKEVKALVASIQHHPELIEVGEQQRPVEAIRQHFYTVEQDLKLRLLLHILKNEKMDSVLVFSRTKHGADKISRRLEKNGLKSVAIHANRTQAQRQRALAGFKQGQFNVMVATDIAARGIDVEGISHVVNYDTPAFAEDYLHRIGRTGRATLSGDAITFVSGQERKYLKGIEYFVGKKYEVKRYPGFDYARVDEHPAPPAAETPHPKARTHVRSQRHAGETRPSSRQRQERGGRRDTRSNRDGGRRDHRRPESKNAPAPVKPDSDWRKLIEEGKSEREGFRKKLKKLFRRG